MTKKTAIESFINCKRLRNMLNFREAERERVNERKKKEGKRNNLRKRNCTCILSGKNFIFWLAIFELSGQLRVR